eukprot:gene1049-375_t
MSQLKLVLSPPKKKKKDEIKKCIVHQKAYDDEKTITEFSMISWNKVKTAGLIRNDAVVIQLTSELEENDIRGSESSYHGKCYSNYTHPKTLASIERERNRNKQKKQEMMVVRSQVPVMIGEARPILTFTFLFVRVGRVALAALYHPILTIPRRVSSRSEAAINVTCSAKATTTSSNCESRHSTKCANDVRTQPIDKCTAYHVETQDTNVETTAPNHQTTTLNVLSTAPNGCSSDFVSGDDLEAIFPLSDEDDFEDDNELVESITFSVTEIESQPTEKKIAHALSLEVQRSVIQILPPRKSKKVLLATKYQIAVGLALAHC